MMKKAGVIRVSTEGLFFTFSQRDSRIRGNQASWIQSDAMG